LIFYSMDNNSINKFPGCDRSVAMENLTTFNQIMSLN
jgi:hypothetical protein